MVFSPTECTVDWIGLDFEKWTHGHLCEALVELYQLLLKNNAERIKLCHSF